MIDKFYRAYKLINRCGSKILSVLYKGRSITSLELVLSIKNYCPSLSTIIDVGANKGQFALASHFLFSTAQIYSFEPLPDVYLVLNKNIKGISDIKAFNFALGSINGKIKFYENEYSQASSALKTINIENFSGGDIQNIKVIDVEVKRFDDLSKEMTFKPPLLLKLDVQGFEKEVLKGAENFFKKVDYLLIESTFVPSYENQPLFDEMHSYVRGLGFELIAPVGVFRQDDYRIAQMDILYKNSL